MKNYQQICEEILNLLAELEASLDDITQAAKTEPQERLSAETESVMQSSPAQKHENRSGSLLRYP